MNDKTLNYYMKRKTLDMLIFYFLKKHKIYLNLIIFSKKIDKLEINKNKKNIINQEKDKIIKKILIEKNKATVEFFLFNNKKLYYILRYLVFCKTEYN